MLDIISEFAAIIELDGTIVWLNKTTRDHFRVSAGENIGSSNVFADPGAFTSCLQEATNHGRSRTILTAHAAHSEVTLDIQILRSEEYLLFAGSVISEEYIPIFNEMTSMMSDLATLQRESVHTNRVLEQQRVQLEVLNETLNRDRAHLEAIINQMPAGILLAEGSDHAIFRTNRLVSEIWKLDQEPSQLSQLNLANKEGTPICLNKWPLTRSLSTGETVVNEEYLVVRSDGSEVSVLVNSGPIEDGEGTIIASAMTVMDISEQVTMRNELRRITLQDPLTGLANRSAFFDAIRALLATHETMNHAVIYLDLDGFKQINDTWGHEAGDEVLVAVAQRFQSTVRSGDIVARIGGDEFTVLLADLDHPLVASDIAQRMITVGSAPIAVRNYEIQVGVSAGIRNFCDNDSDPDIIIHQADLALYQAKRGGKEQAVVFDERYFRK